MIITKVSCDNMYMFNNFSLDLTYQKKRKHHLSENDVLFDGSKIKVRKNVIIMGGNASGKTTFGKLLRFISNYIFRGQVVDDFFHLSDIPYKKDEISCFSLEFVIDSTAYLLEVSFRGNSLINETLSSCKIYRSHNIKKMRENLEKADAISQYNNTLKKETKMLSDNLVSYAFLVNVSSESEYIKSEIKYFFSISQRNNDTLGQYIDTHALNDILPKIDNTVRAVKSMYVDNKSTTTYQIIFNNKENLVVPKGDIESCKDRLSHGTFEAIEFLKLLTLMKNNPGAMIYVDEMLAHMHSELEAYLIRKAILIKPVQSQIFISTHNIDIFQLNVPINVFVFFKRNSNGYNDAMYPSDILNKNDRNLTQYYVNDYFGVMPDYSILDQSFEEYFFEDTGELK